MRARRRLLHEFVIVAVRQVGRRRLFIARDRILHGPRRCAVPLAGHVAVSVELLHPQMPERCVAEEVLLATVSPTPGHMHAGDSHNQMKNAPKPKLGHGETRATETRKCHLREAQVIARVGVVLSVGRKNPHRWARGAVCSRPSTVGKSLHMARIPQIAEFLLADETRLGETCHHVNGHGASECAPRPCRARMKPVNAEEQRAPRSLMD